jgi:hypothetical protein
MTQNENIISGTMSTPGDERITPPTRRTGLHVARMHEKQPAREQHPAGLGAALLGGGRAAPIAARYARAARWARRGARDGRGTRGSCC